MFSSSAGAPCASDEAGLQAPINALDAPNFDCRRLA
jgi:hypothetical protein